MLAKSSIFLLSDRSSTKTRGSCQGWDGSHARHVYHAGTQPGLGQILDRARRWCDPALTAQLSRAHTHTQAALSLGKTFCSAI